MVCDFYGAIDHDNICFILLTGQIEQMTYKAVKKLDASCKYTGPGSYSKEKVPHFKEMLAECKKHGENIV